MAGTYGPQTVFNESVSASTADNSVILGTRRIEGGKEFVYVYNAGATTASIGYGVIQSGHSGFSVSMTAALGDACFGVVQNADIEGEEYGWIQVKGQANLATTDDANTAAIGDSLYLVAGGGFGVVTTGATGSTWIAGHCAVAQSTQGTAQTGSCYVHCYG